MLSGGLQMHLPMALFHSHSVFLVDRMDLQRASTCCKDEVHAPPEVHAREAMRAPTGRRPADPPQS